MNELLSGLLSLLTVATPVFGVAPSVLKVQQGGTGASTFTIGECLKGNGTGPITTGSCGSGTADGTFSTTSASFWIDQYSKGYFFSTTSADFWETQQAARGGSAAGSDTQIQFNDGSAFGGDAHFLFNKTTNTVTLGDVDTEVGTIQSPAGTADLYGGYLTVKAGAGNGVGRGGILRLNSGAGGSTANGGALFITSGDGGATSGDGGLVQVTAGNAQTSGVGGSFFADAGGGAGAGNDGGNVEFSAGSAGGAGGTAGNVVFNIASANGGTDGKFKFKPKGGSIYGILDFDSLTASDKTFTFPDQSGTICLVGVACDGSGGSGFSTTSTDYWETTKWRWATTSASYFLSQNQGLAFSTTSANWWGSEQGYLTSYTETDPNAVLKTQYYSTTTHPLISSLPSLSITRSQVSDFGGPYDSVTTAGDGLTRTVNDFDCDIASGTVFGCISAVDWTRFNSATTTFTAPLVYSTGTNAVTCTTASASVPGCLAAVDFSRFNSATTTFSYPLTYSTATNAVSFPATSTLYGSGTGGQVLVWNNTLGRPSFAATSTCLQITGSAGLCDGDDATGGGGGGAWPFDTSVMYNGRVNTQSTTSPLWIRGNMLAASSSHLTYASSTQITATSLCLTGDTCRTTWPGGATTITAGSTSSDATIAGLTSTGLAFSATANTNYLIDCYVLYTSSAVGTGISFAWDTPADPKLILMTGDTVISGSAVNGFWQHRDGMARSTSTAVLLAGLLNQAVLNTHFRNGANAGTITLQFTPETANSVSVGSESVCQYRTY